MKQLFIALAFTVLSGFAWAQDTTAKTAQSPQKRMLFFASEEPVELTLVSDFKKLKGRKEKHVFQPATVTLTLPKQSPVTEDIQVSVRGKTRREICIMPPLLLDFKNLKAPNLSYLKKLKLVVGCTANPYDEELVLKEYLIYKIYNMLTDMSYNVRLTKVSYKDAQNRTKEYSQYGFLVEDLDDVAKRNGCREFNGNVLNSLHTDANQMTLVSMFEYMIGNTDWALPNKHNMKFIQLLTDSLSRPYAVPYDFDYSGLVNAPYAIPQPEFGIEKVTDRYYRGAARTKETVQPLIQLFKEKKEFIIAKVMGFELLNKKVREKMVGYLEDFYKDLDDTRKVKYVFEQAVDHY